jgi:hypothetical protein
VALKLLMFSKLSVGFREKRSQPGGRRASIYAFPGGNVNGNSDV